MLDGVATLDSHYFSCLLFLFLPVTVLLRKLVCFSGKMLCIDYAQIELVTKMYTCMTRKLAKEHLDKNVTIIAALSEQIRLQSYRTKRSHSFSHWCILLTACTASSVDWILVQNCCGLIQWYMYLKSAPSRLEDGPNVEWGHGFCHLHDSNIQLVDKKWR